MRTVVLQKGDLFEKDVKRIYESSFPKPERYQLDSLYERNLFLGFVEEEHLRGIVYLLYDTKALFLLYLAVDEQCRGKGYGGKIMEWILDFAGKRCVFLNVEEPDDTSFNQEERERRIRFYERYGLKMTKIKLKDQDVTYVLMSEEKKWKSIPVKWSAVKLLRKLPKE